MTPTYPKECKHIVPFNDKCIHIKTQTRYRKAIGCPKVFKTGIPCHLFTPKTEKDNRNE